MLVTVTEAIQSLGLNSDLEDQIAPTITKALLKAQIRLEAEIETKLNKRECIEKFYLDSDIHSGVMQAGLLTLRLCHSYVHEDPAVVVRVCKTWRGEFSTVPGSHFQVDHEAGLVFLDEIYEKHYANVVYNSGFHHKTPKLPSDLKEVLLALLPVVMTTLSDGDQKSDQNGPNAAVMAATMITPLKRAKGIHFRPFNRTHILA